MEKCESTVCEFKATQGSRYCEQCLAFIRKDLNWSPNATDAARSVLHELVLVAAEEGRKERERLGRDLTETEAAALAEIVERQFQIALAMAR